MNKMFNIKGGESLMMRLKKQCVAFIVCLFVMVTCFSMPNIKNVSVNAADSEIVAGIKQFQTYINNNLPIKHLGTPLVVDGICNQKTQIAAVKLIQYYINTTYGECLDIDGHFGPASQIAFHKYKGVIRYREVGFWVYMLQGLLYCHGYDPKGFDGSYGSGGGTGCLNAVNAYKLHHFINEYPGTNGEVGVETMASLCWKSSLAQKTFYIRNKANGRYLCKSSTSVSLSAYNGSADQKWQFNYIENGEFRLINLGDSVPTSGQYIYALNAFSGTSVNVQPGSTSSSNQRWVLIGKLDNLRLINKTYGKALKANSTSSVTLDNQDTSYERWELIEASNPYVLPYIDSNITVSKFNQTKLINYMNCYTYALGYYDDTAENFLERLQPGFLSGSPDIWDVVYDNIVSTPEGLMIDDTGVAELANSIIENTDADLNYMFEEPTSVQRIYPSSLNERIVGPWKKVALVIDNVTLYTDIGFTFDYHWYVQHEDGKWSHKPGLTEVTVLDGSGNIITNPETCDRDNTIYPGWEYNYYVFVGYFKIRIDAIYHDGARSHSEWYKWDNAGDIASMSNSLPLITSSSPMQVMGSIEYWDTKTPYLGATEPDVFTYRWEGDADWYEFMVNEAGVYIIQTTGSTSLFSMLFDGTTLLNFDNDYMQVALSPGKLYKLKISGVSSGSYGNYTLTIKKS